MDYCHTEDFARRMEAAELRAQMLRDEAITRFFLAVGRAVRKFAQRIVRSCADKLLPEA